MSLINQVLKDLESRRGHAADTSGLRPASADQRSRDWPRWFIALTVAVTLGVVLFVGEQLWHMRAPPAAEPVATPVETTPPVRIDESPATELEPELEIVPPPESVFETMSDPEPDTNAASVAMTESEAGPEPEPTADREPAAPTRTEAPDETVETPPVVVQERTLRTSSPQQRADEAYTRGVQALAEGRRSEAERQFREALGHDASLHVARLALANLLGAHGQSREAELQLQQGLRIAPDAHPLAYRYAHLLVERGDLGGAIGVLSEAPPPLATAPDYHALLAWLLQRAGHHEEAAERYARLVEHAPDRSMWWVGLAMSQEELGRGTAALEAYRRAVGDPRLTGEVARFVHSRITALQDAAMDEAR